MKVCGARSNLLEVYGSCSDSTAVHSRAVNSGAQTATADRLGLSFEVRRIRLLAIQGKFIELIEKSGWGNIDCVRAMVGLESVKLQASESLFYTMFGK